VSARRGLLLCALAVLGGCELIVDPPRLGTGATGCPVGRCLVVTTVPHFETTSTVAQVAASVSVPAAATGEDWLVLVSARLSWGADAGDGLSQIQAHCRVDGVRRTEAEGALEDADGDGQVDGSAPWQHVDVVRDAASKRIDVDVSSLSGTTVAIDDLTVLAFRVPPGADLHEQSTPDLRALEAAGGWQAVEQLTVQPVAAGDYLVMAAAVPSRSPSTTGGVGVRLASPQGDLWPGASGGGSSLAYLGNPRDHAQPLFLARAVTLGLTPSEFVLEASAGPDGSEIQYTRLVALRLDAFADFAQHAALPEQEVAQLAPTPIAELELPARAAAREWIVLQSVTLAAPGWREVSFAGPTTLAITQYFDGAGLTIDYGRFAAVTTADATTLTTSVRAADAATPVSVKESVIVALALP
jgi:hypothetical protein